MEEKKSLLKLDLCHLLSPISGESRGAEPVHILLHPHGNDNLMAKKQVELLLVLARGIHYPHHKA